MNPSNEKRARKSLIGQVMDSLWRGSGRAWGYHRHWLTGTPMDRPDDNGAPSDEGESLPHAELSEEERKRAVEEMRRRPRVG